MAFSEFSLKEAVRRFDLRIESRRDYFAFAPDSVPGPRLTATLDECYDLAIENGTEKARSEFIIAPILVDLRSKLRNQFGLHSGVELTAAPDRGLNGTCDFVFTRSPLQLYLSAPLLMIVEAMKENVQAGLGQCVASMVGARLYNEKDGGPPGVIFGAVTSGTIWLFLRLDLEVVTLDSREYSIEHLPKVLGILTWMLTQNDQPGQLVA